MSQIAARVFASTVVLDYDGTHNTNIESSTISKIGLTSGTNMRYTFELPSPDYELLLDALRSACVHRAAYGASMQVRYGRTSPQHRAVIVEIAKLNNAITILEEARCHAVPERAVQSTESPARNAGDEMRLVYGRPRNDPRDARTGTNRMPRK